MTNHSADEFRDAVRAHIIALHHDMNHLIGMMSKVEPLDVDISIHGWIEYLKAVLLSVDTWQDRLDFEREADRQAREAEQEETVF